QVGVALRNSFGLRRHGNSPALPTKRRNHVLLSRTTAAIPWKQLDGDKRTRFVGEKVLAPKQRLSLWVTRIGCSLLSQMANRTSSPSRRPPCSERPACAPS